MVAREIHGRPRSGSAVLVTLLSCVGLLIASCGPAPEASSRASSSAPAGERPAGPKTLRLGMHEGEEPTEGIALFGPGGTGAPEHTLALHAGLISYDPDDNVIPHLAQKVPSVEDGDWKVLPDGQMEVTWKLQPGVRWHDGALLTADDFVFGTQAALDLEVPHRRSRAMGLIRELVAPDAETLVVRWKELYILANAPGPIEILALPRHLADDLYRQDKAAFTNSPLWTREFVGLGPYRMGEWVFGERMEILAFDQYFLGRPKIDRISIRYVGDVNTLVANLLAGEIDGIPIGSLKTEQVVALKQSWEPSGAGFVLAIIGGVRTFYVQFREPGAPWVRDLRARQALLHMLDRTAVADTLQYGLTTAADTLPAPHEPAYKLLEQRGFTRYPFDLARAERLLGDAGWRRGADGSYRSSSGEPFVIDVAATSRSPQNVQEAEAVADQWKTTGLSSKPALIPPTATNSNELIATSQGGVIWPLMNYPTAMEAFHSSQIPTAANRWQGGNRGNYSNPAFDRLFDQYVTTLELPRRQGLLADVLKLAADEAIFFPLYYSFGTETMAFRKGIRGPSRVGAQQIVNAWNIQTWELE